MLGLRQLRFPLGSLLPSHQAPVLASSVFRVVDSPIHRYTSPKLKKSVQLFAKRGRGSGERPVAVEPDYREDAEDEDQVGSKEEGGDDDDDDDDDSYEGFRNERFWLGPSGYRGKREERDYDKDPELAEIIGGYAADPLKAQSKMDERLRKKRNKILHSKTGSSAPMKVTFNKFDFSDSFIWFEFHNIPLERDLSLICDTIRSWHIIGRLGGCNSMNMQLSQSTFDKRPSYDYIQGANVDPTTFYNIGNFEIQDNLARIWVDIGIWEPLLLDVLVNALTQINSDFVGIKQLVFGGKELEGWKEGLTSEDAGCSVRKI